MSGRHEVKHAPRDSHAWDVYLGDTPQTHLTWDQKELAQRICDRMNAFVDGGGRLDKAALDMIVADRCDRWGSECLKPYQHIGHCVTKDGDAIANALKDLDVLTWYAGTRRS